MVKHRFPEGAKYSIEVPSVCWVDSAYSRDLPSRNRMGGSMRNHILIESCCCFRDW